MFYIATCIVLQFVSPLLAYNGYPDQRQMCQPQGQYCYSDDSCCRGLFCDPQASVCTPDPDIQCLQPNQPCHLDNWTPGLGRCCSGLSCNYGRCGYSPYPGSGCKVANQPCAVVFGSGEVSGDCCPGLRCGRDEGQRPGMWPSSGYRCIQKCSKNSFCSHGDECCPGFWCRENFCRTVKEPFNSGLSFRSLNGKNSTEKRSGVGTAANKTVGSVDEKRSSRKTDE